MVKLDDQVHASICITTGSSEGRITQRSKIRMAWDFAVHLNGGRVLLCVSEI